MKSTRQNNGGFIGIVVVVAIVIAGGLGFAFWHKAQTPAETMDANYIQARNDSANGEADSLSASLEASAKVDSSADLNAIDAEYK
ncbi:MAG: hypothetical protein V4467_02850 [Patescibacteria group bacterium]